MALLNEPHWLLLHQRRHGTLLLVSQARVNEFRHHRRHQSGKTQRLPVHRNALQFNENSPDPGYRTPDEFEELHQTKLAI